MGLSFGKLLLLVLLVAAVWLGIMIYRRSVRQRDLAETKTPKPLGAVATVECPVCRTYRAVGAKPCGRNDCPIT